jgi:hypothetical protein
MGILLNKLEGANCFKISEGQFVKFPEETTTRKKPLIPNKLGQARNETQSKIIQIRDLKYQKSMIVIVIMIDTDSQDDENNDNKFPD